MTPDTLRGEGNTIGGQVKETVGSTTGDRSMQAGGILDQVKGAIQKTIGGASDMANGTTGTAGSSEMVGKAKQFAKDRPWATAALAGVVGMAVLNSLRGRR